MIIYGIGSDDEKRGESEPPPDIQLEKKSCYQPDERKGKGVNGNTVLFSNRHLFYVGDVPFLSNEMQKKRTTSIKKIMGVTSMFFF